MVPDKRSESGRRLKQICIEMFYSVVRSCILAVRDGEPDDAQSAAQ